MKADETKFILIFADSMLEGDHVERFITKEALEEYLNDPNSTREVGDDAEVYEVKPYQIKKQISVKELGLKP